MRQLLLASVSASAIGLSQAGIFRPGYHRYWRVKVPTTQGGAAWSVAEIELLPKLYEGGWNELWGESWDGTFHDAFNDMSGPRTVTSSSDDGTNLADNVKDDDLSTYLQTTDVEDGWVMFDFTDFVGGEMEVIRIKYTNPPNAADAQPEYIKLEYSDDAELWYEAFLIEVKTPWTAQQETREFTLDYPDDNLLRFDYRKLPSTFTLSESHQVVENVSQGNNTGYFLPTIQDAAKHRRVKRYWEVTIEATGDNNDEFDESEIGLVDEELANNNLSSGMPIYDRGGYGLSRGRAYHGHDSGDYVTPPKSGETVAFMFDPALGDLFIRGPDGWSNREVNGSRFGAYPQIPEFFMETDRVWFPFVYPSKQGDRVRLRTTTVQFVHELPAGAYTLTYEFPPEVSVSLATAYVTIRPRSDALSLGKDRSFSLLAAQYNKLSAARIKSYAIVEEA